MTISQPNAAASQDADPLERFSHCHSGILRQLKSLGELPAAMRAAAEARQRAEETVRFFQDVIHEHHAQEEKELFPAVLGSAIPGDELAHVQRIVDQLTREHREVEAAWARLEPELKAFARGREGELDAAAVDALVQRYQAHAAFEEREFLPLSEQILGRNAAHLSALGLSLHMRDAVPEALQRYRGRI